MNKNNKIFKLYELITGQDITTYETHTALYFNIFMGFLTFILFTPFYILMRLAVRYLLHDYDGVEWSCVLFSGIMGTAIVGNLEVFNDVNVFLLINLSAFLIVVSVFLVLIIAVIIAIGLSYITEYMKKLFKINKNKIEWK